MDYRHSLRLMLCSCVCGNMFGVIRNGAAFTGYTSYLGISDRMYGLLMAMPYLGALTQLSAAALMNHTGQRKKWVLLFGGISRFVWIPISIVPLLLPRAGNQAHIWIITLLYGLSSVCSSTINVGFTPWMGEFVPPKIRGRWLAHRYRIESVVSVSMGLLIAWLLNRLPAPVSYYTVLMLGAVIGCIDICFYIGVKEMPVKTQNVGLIASLRETLKNRSFAIFCLFWICLNFSKALSSAYFIRYAGENLSLNDGQCVLCFQLVVCAVGFVCISYWGKMADVQGYMKVLTITQSVLALTPLLWLFSSPKSLWIPLIYNIVATVMNCSQTMLSTGLLLELAPREQSIIYMAVYSLGVQLLGSFPGSLCGGALLSFFRKVTFLGLDAYQMLFTSSALLQVVTLLLFLPKMKQRVRR